MKQPDLFRTEPTGTALRDEALGRFEERERSWIRRARQRMVELILERRRAGHIDHDICSDDVWDLCPPPADCHPSVMGPVFRGGLFVKVGWRASKRPSAHARMVSTYRLKE
jgi:hypothetical protein